VSIYEQHTLIQMHSKKQSRHPVTHQASPVKIAALQAKCVALDGAGRSVYHAMGSSQKDD